MTSLIIYPLKLYPTKYYVLTKTNLEEIIRKVQIFINSLIELLFCPITHCEFDNPVVASDRRTYDLEAIYNWTENNSTSPLTRKFILRIFHENKSVKYFKLLLNDIKEYFEINNINIFKFEDIEFDKKKPYSFKIIKIAKKRKYIKLDTFTKDIYNNIKLYEIIMDIFNFIRLFLEKNYPIGSVPVVAPNGLTYDRKIALHKFPQQPLFYNFFCYQLLNLYNEAVDSIFI